MRCYLYTFICDNFCATDNFICLLFLVITYCILLIKRCMENLVFVKIKNLWTMLWKSILLLTSATMKTRQNIPHSSCLTSSIKRITTKITLPIQFSNKIHLCFFFLFRLTQRQRGKRPRSQIRLLTILLSRIKSVDIDDQLCDIFILI